MVYYYYYYYYYYYCQCFRLVLISSNKELVCTR